MKQIFGMSQSGDLKEAVANIKDPSALFLFTQEDKLEAQAKELEELFPGVPAIGAVGESYGDHQSTDSGTTVVALCDGIKAIANRIEELPSKPIKYLQRLKEDLKTIDAKSNNTVCIDYCTCQDSRLLTTLNILLKKSNISLVGGSSNSNIISVNGKIYEDACAYMLVKNLNGKVKVYKENIYTSDKTDIMTATKTNTKNFEICEIDRKAAEQVYREKLHITKEEVATQTFKNPLGRCYGDEVYIASIKQVNGSNLECYRQVNNMDQIVIMDLADYSQIVKDTVAQIKNDFTHVSSILSVNCIFRYLLFKEEKYWDEYLKEMCSECTHAGLVGVGEHFYSQLVNQTMCCVVFE